MIKFCIQVKDNHTPSGGDLPLSYKGLSLGPPVSKGPKILGVRTVSSISASIIFVFLFWFNARFLLCR